MKEIRRILKEETAIPENIDKAMEDVLSGILNSPDEKTTGALSKKTNGERTKNSGNKKKIIRILLPVAAILGVSTGVLATNIGRIFVIPIEDAIRIRTGERGDIALYNAEQER